MGDLIGLIIGALGGLISIVIIVGSIYLGIKNIEFNKAHGCAPLATSCSINIAVNK